MNPFITGFIGASLIAGLAYMLRALTVSGALAALLVGTAIFGGGGASASVTLLLFFISGSALSKLPRAVEKETARRDWRQVMANGLVPGACALGNVLFPHPSWSWGFYGSLATAAADTWATEFGTRFGRRPWDILHWQRRLEPGLSGGVSNAGLLASMAGASLIALSSLLQLPGLKLAPRNGRTVVLLTLVGFIGALLDSLLGSAFQAKYECTTCHVALENKIHPHPVRLLSGSPWMTNNMVNLLTVVSGALLAAAAGFDIWK